MRRFACLVAGFACMPAQSQSMEKAYVIAEPLQYSKQGDFRGCGINVKMLEEGDLHVRDYVSVSVNFWIDSPGVALVKTTYSEATPGRQKPLQPKQMASTWVRLKHSKPLVSLKSLKGDDEALLMVTPLEGAMDFATAIAQSGELQVGFTPHGSKTERIIYGKSEVTQESKRIIAECFDEYIKRLDAVLEDPKQRPAQ
jgi:hypothetical protein